MNQDIERLKVFIRLKWIVLAFPFIYTVFGLLIAPMRLIGFALIAGQLLSAANNFLLGLAAKRGRFGFVYCSIYFDLLLVVLAIYLGGGIENSWLFFPVILIVAAGYLFTMRATIAFLAACSFSIGFMYLLEHFGTIPHFSAYGFPESVWKNPKYDLDYLIGTFFLFSFVAFTSAYIKRYVEQASVNLEKNVEESRSAQKESEDSRKALINITEDLEIAKKELEERVKERTAELEGAKKSLAVKVEERTADLEGSRRAVIHMMRDMKDDMEKLKAVDKIKTEFLSVVSHELRTPITPIKGFTSMLLSGQMGTLTEKQRQAIDIIAKEGEHLLELIESILDVGRLERGRPLEIKKEPISLAAFTKELMGVLEPQYSARGIGVEVDIPEDLPTVLADPAKLRRLVTNLIGNAMKFTPRGGKIGIVGLKRDNDVEIQVIDNGIGIAKENIGKLFQRFYQVDSSMTRTEGGVGLGLAIVKEIAEAHGGKIWAESEGLGKGTKIIFTLPLGA